MKDKYLSFLLPIFLLFSLIACVFIFSFTSHAESYFPMDQNDNGIFSDSVINSINTYYNSENNYIFAFYDSAPFNWKKTYYVLYFSKSVAENDFVYGELKNNGYQFNIYKNGDFPIYYNMVEIDNNGSNLSPYSSSLSNFQNLTSSLYNSNKSYVSNFKLYSSNNTNNRSVVLNYGADGPEPIGQGHAIPPDPFESPTLATGSNYILPREVPESPTIINYSWTTYNNPLVDNSSTNSLLESIFDILSYNAGYLTTNISNEFDNLITNIKGYIDYVSKTIQYYGGLIISNIQNGINTLYNNMVSLIEPIFDKLDYFTQPFDSDVVSAAFTSTNFYGIKNQFVNTFTTFDNAFDISEPDSFTVVFNVQNITPLYDLGVRSPVTVDLGANFLPIRAALRTFLWILVTFGSVFVVEHGLSNWLRGARKE